MNKQTSLLVVGITCATVAQAQSADTVRAQELNPVEVVALRASTKAPFALTNLKKKDIQKGNDGRDVFNLLDQTPSVLINSDAGAGVGYTDIRVRGTDGQRINVTINGIPVNDAESQGSFMVNIPDLISSASSIQIQRGVGSSTNGSGAFGGTVNISNIEQNDEASVRLINTVGSFNTLRHTLTAGTGRLKGGFNMDVRLSKVSSDGYIDRSASDMKSIQFITGWTSNNNKTNIKFNLFSGKQKTGQSWNGVPQDSLKTNRTYNELGLEDDGTFYKDQTDNYQQDFYQLFVNHKFNNHLKVNAGLYLTRGRGFYNEYKSGEDYGTYGLPNHVVGNDTVKQTSLTRQLWLDNYYYGGVASLIYTKNRTSLIFGGALSQYDAKHYGFVKWAENGGVPLDYRWYNLRAFKTDANIYGKLEQELFSHFYGFADLQLRSVSYTINGFRKHPTVYTAENYLFFNPKAGFSYVTNHHKAFASFAIANKEPNRDDFEAGVNQIPKPEQLNDIEIGYQYFGLKGSVGANLYYMLYKDQLVATGKVNDVGAYTRTNVAQSFRRGIELFGNTTLAPWVSLAANMTLSQNKIKSFTEYIDDYDNGGQKEIVHHNSDIALSPGIIAGGTISFKPFSLPYQQQFSIDLIGKYVGRQYLDNTSDKKRSIDPYGLANVRLSYSIQNKWIKDASLSLMVNNILDRKYESKGYTFSYVANGIQTSNYYYPQAGRNYLLTLSLGF
ncbi:TonB-dependent receptor [Taibaiella sp. KBW10]|uniref:TonB-dependent receptor n=1 Tax=Taibaiella sp. KBW10 TaxID=2153357 RepID=UPI000F591620|nr:TonB-dependent receptor plug domain-containing protein [Taibaiella sp. KBW10]RQO30933.1 TonB-dependent receptor [Taibaiella sp. KBW10]